MRLQLFNQFNEKFDFNKLSDEDQVTTGVTKDLIRLSVGLEDIEDLKADLKAVFDSFG